MITHEEARIASMLTTVEASRIMIDYINQQETLQAEHETLKKDVARYFETRNRLKTILPNANDITEFWALEEKLLKAGKEE